MNQGDKPNPFDPFGAFAGMRDASMETWSRQMINLVESEEYAKATGAVLDSYLSASAPFRQALEKAMTQALGQLNMPTRAEITSLADRLTNIETRLDDLDAKLDTLIQNRPDASRSRKA